MWLPTILLLTQSSYLTLRMEHTDSKRNNYLYAVKVVRGAYIDEERRLVQEKGYEGKNWQKQDLHYYTFCCDRSYTL